MSRYIVEMTSIGVERIEYTSTHAHGHHNSVKDDHVAANPASAI